MGGLPRAIAVSAVTAGMAGAALALWSPGSLAAAGLGSDVPPAAVTVIPEYGPADLYPGFDGGDLTVRLKNPNPFPLVVDSMTPGDVTSSDPDACPASSITVHPATGLALAVPARTTTGPLAIPDVVSMAEDAPEGCQGVGFTIALEVGGADEKSAG